MYDLKLRHASVHFLSYRSKNAQISMFSAESKDTLVNKQLANFNIDQTVVEQLLDENQKAEFEKIKIELSKSFKNAKKPPVD